MLKVPWICSYILVAILLMEQNHNMKKKLIYLHEIELDQSFVIVTFLYYNRTEWTYILK